MWGARVPAAAPLACHQGYHVPANRRCTGCGLMLGEPVAHLFNAPRWGRHPAGQHAHDGVGTISTT